MKRNDLKQTLLTGLITLGLGAQLTSLPTLAQAGQPPQAEAASAVRYNTVTIEGQEIFYREAGQADAPVVLLLHGFPTSSQQYRNLIPELAEDYRVIAPDYPGFGASAMPDRAEFDYSFASYAALMDGFTDALALDSYSLYVMDYGAPVGYRLALKEPEAVEALIIQNGNAYDEGLLEFWDVFRTYWADGGAETREPLRDFLNVTATEWQYTHGVPESHVHRVSPDAWMLDQAYLDRPGNQEIQLDLFYDYRTNVDLYPEFQAYFRAHQPPTLIVWGENDYIFPAEGAAPYLRDLPEAELHMIDAGHFILESHGPEVAGLIREFLDKEIQD